MSSHRNRNRKIVPECHSAIDQMKYEIAAELGLPVWNQAGLDANSEFATELGTKANGQVGEGDWGHIASRDTGRVGGSITRRLIQQAEQTLNGQN